MRRLAVVSAVGCLAAFALASCTPKPASNPVLDAAVGAYFRMQIDSAATGFAHVVRTDPGNADALAWLADARRRQGQPDTAIALARGALVRKPGHGFAHFVLGATYDPIKSGWEGTSRDSAVAHYRAAADATPSEPDGWIGLRLYASIAGDTTALRESLAGLQQSGFLTPACAAWGRFLLEGLPPNAVLLTNGDMDTFPCELVQLQGTRPDVAVVNLSLLNVGEYARSLTRLYGLPMPAAVESGATDEAGAAQGPNGIRTVADLVLDQWQPMAESGRFPRPLFAAATVMSARLMGPGGATMRAHLAGPRWHVAPPADTTADLAMFSASVRAMDPSAFAGRMAAAVDRSPVRQASADMLGFNVAATAIAYGRRAHAAGDTAGMQLALEKLEGLRHSVALGDSLARPIENLRQSFGLSN